jgi:hypothetical protein
MKFRTIQRKTYDLLQSFIIVREHLDLFGASVTAKRPPRTDVTESHVAELSLPNPSIYFASKEQKKIDGGYGEPEAVYRT